MWISIILEFAADAALEIIHFLSPPSLFCDTMSPRNPAAKAKTDIAPSTTTVSNTIIYLLSKYTHNNTAQTIADTATQTAENVTDKTHEITPLNAEYAAHIAAQGFDLYNPCRDRNAPYSDQTADN